MSKLIGRGKGAALTLWELSQLQELWALVYPDYRIFLDLYHTTNPFAMRNARTQNIIDWNCMGATEEQERWQEMEQTITV
jgi:hypothetical protein